jgi:O-antigen/teichoic acid export membrane protein
LYSSIVSILTGLEKMKERSSLSIIQTSLTGIFVPVLVYLGYSIPGALYGYIISYTLCAFIGFILINKTYFNLYNIFSFNNIINDLSVLLNYGFPLYLGKIIAGLNKSLKGLFFSWFISSELIGNYGVSNRFLFLITVLTNSIAISLFPTFSKFDYNLDKKKTINFFLLSIKYISILIIPLLFFIISISYPMIDILYTSKYDKAPYYLTLLLLPRLFVGYGSLSINNFLNSQGYTRTSLIIRIIGSIFNIIVMILLVKSYGIEGLIISNFFSSMIRNIFSVKMINRIFNIDIDVIFSIKVLFISFISYFLSTLTNIFMLNSYIIIIIKTVVFLIVYMILAPLFNVINSEDIDKLNNMLRSVGFLYPIIKFILIVESNIIKIIRQKK